MDLGERFGNYVEQSNTVLGFDVNDGTFLGGIVVKVNTDGNALALQGLKKRTGRLLLLDQRAEIDFGGRSERAEKDGLEALAGFARDQPARLGVRDKKSIEDDPIGAA